MGSKPSKYSFLYLFRIFMLIIISTAILIHSFILVALSVGLGILLTDANHSMGNGQSIDLTIHKDLDSTKYLLPNIDLNRTQVTQLTIMLIAIFMVKLTLSIFEFYAIGQEKSKY